MSPAKKIFLTGIALIMLFFLHSAFASADTSPPVEKVTFTFNLQKGINLISLPVLASYTAESFARINGSSVNYITMYNTTSQEQKTYIAGFSGKDDNFEVKPDYGYFVFANGNCSFTVTGGKAGVRNVALYKGLNLVGWTSLEKSTAVDAFAAPLGSNLINISKRNSDGSFQTYIPGVSGNAENFIVEPGSGYMIHVKNDCILTYSGAQGPAGEPLPKEPAAGKAVPGFEAADAIFVIASILLMREIKR